MRNKVAKEVRKYLRQMYPNVEKEDPVTFERMCDALKKKYKSTSVDQKGKIIE